MIREGHIEIKLPNNIAFICALRAFIKSLAQRLEFHPSRVDDIELVIDELCGNAMEHGSEPDSQITLIISIRSWALDILVRDEGKRENAFHFLRNLPKIRRECLSPYSERGRGIYITGILSDYFCFSLNHLGGIDARVIFYRF